MAVAVAVLLLTLPAPRPPSTDAGIVQVPGFIGERAYEPAIFVDGQTSIGTLRAGRTRTAALAVVSDGKVLRTLRDGAAQFIGVTAVGDRVAWLEQPSTADGPAIWSADWRTGPARVLTRDVGDFAFFNAQDDLRIDLGRVRWIAGAPGEIVRSELRTVALGGGPVDRRIVDGAWQLAGAYRLASVMTGDAPAQVLDWRTGARTQIRSQPGELITCGETWCRAIVFGGDGGSIRIDLLYADGTGRRTAVSGSATAPLIDVALLGRFEAYTRMGSTTAGQQLLLYDVTSARLTVLAGEAGQIVGRHGFLWWSTGTGENLVWHVLDLHRL